MSIDFDQLEKTAFALLKVLEKRDIASTEWNMGVLELIQGIQESAGIVPDPISEQVPGFVRPDLKVEISCASCPFWADPEGGKDGECRRYPPRDCYGTYPTAPDHWCAEHPLYPDVVEEWIHGRG